MSQKEWSDYALYVQEGPESRRKVERPAYVEYKNDAQYKKLVDQIQRALQAVGAPPLSKKELSGTRPDWRDVTHTGPQNETALPGPTYMSPQAREREMGQVVDQQKLELIKEILELANIDFIRGTPTDEQKALLAEQLKNYERAQGRDSLYYKTVLKRYKEYYGIHGMGKHRKCPKCGLLK